MPLAGISWRASRRGCGSARRGSRPRPSGCWRAYDCPGNVRELRNVIERAVILSDDGVIGADCIVLSGAARTAGARGEPADHFLAVDLDASGRPPDLDGLERAYIARLLEFCAGNRTAVARALGVSYPTVAKKIADYGLG